MAMIVNTAWLLEYLEPACAHDELVQILPELGLEIERQHELRLDLRDVRIGFVREKTALPGDDGMYLCQIEVERGQTVPIVCASEHEVQVGWGVPVAPVGMTLPTGKNVKAGQFHGVSSMGMICLDGEMGMLARASGMHHFMDEHALGQPLPELVSIPEHLIELNVLSNRPDFLGLIGIAREVAAFLKATLRMPPVFTPSQPTASPGKQSGSPLHGQGVVPVELREPGLCPRYMCGLIQGVQVGPSPAWLKSRLLVAGMRPINNVVDVTNYVMYEFGQPLHAFDHRCLRGGRIVVRRMAPGESMELLTGKVLGASGQSANGHGEAKFSEPPLVIADAERAVALAGIMGGRATQTDLDATAILVEAACFDPVNIRRTVREVDLGMESRGTASSYRFERGTDPNRMLEGALARALHLIAELAGGRVAGAVTDAYPQRREPTRLRMSAERTSAYLGMPVEPATIRDLLTRLDMTCDDDLTVHVPTWRAHVSDPVVLIEDVARLIGYDKNPVGQGRGEPTVGVRARRDRLRQSIAEHLVAGGYFETRSPSLESPELASWLGQPSAIVTVANARSAEMSVLRRSLLPALLRTVDGNVRRGAERVRFFETDRVFDPTATAAKEQACECDRWQVGLVAGGLARSSDWRGEKLTDFHVLKGVVEDLIDAVGCPAARFEAVDVAPYVAGTAARITIGGQPAGTMGQVDAELLGLDRLPFRLFACELALDTLELGFAATPQYRPISRQPAVTRDMAVVVARDVGFDAIEKTVRDLAGSQLESFRLVDVYHGQQVAPGHHSLAMRLVFRDAERSLGSDDMSATMARIVESLGTQFGAKLRE